MEKIKSGGAVYEFIKGLIISVVFSLLAVLVFAVIIRFVGIQTRFIPIVNQAIKSLSILFGVLCAFSKRNNGWLRGFIFGILFALVSYLIFSLLAIQLQNTM
jgi:putative membrane protein (TIGR04086 family)